MSRCVKTGVICLGCGGNLFTTQAEIDRRLAMIELLETGDARKGPPSTIRAWCVSDICPTIPRPTPHRAVFVCVAQIPSVVLPK